MRIGILNLKGQVVSAPLAGVSNRSFRLLALKAGAALTYTEMISSEGIIRRQAKTLAMMEFKPDERPIGIQIFGADPEVMSQAARITVGRNSPDLIDINLGCPVRKVIKQNGGAAVLKDFVLMEEIIRATVESVGQTPVTIKIRTGWDDINPVYEKVGWIAEQAGAAAVTLHARSRSKGFSGAADWAAIRKLKDSVSIPVIGNGDVKTPADAKRMLEETGCDGVMIGRAVLGNPFIFKQISHYLATDELLQEPTVRDKITMACRHARLMVEEFGQPRGIVKMRGYLGWYVKGFQGASQLRQRLCRVCTISDIEEIFGDYLNERLVGKSLIDSALSPKQ
jgi:tRNA-dihydrouridine synthase B